MPLICLGCNQSLENETFIKCHTVEHHNFCFDCAKQFIKNQVESPEIHCPSGDKCALNSDTDDPWAFMRNEIEQILGDGKFE